ncbi:hypothetical protein BC831DRAFT_460533, partial [Entophlyctis helioformis]
MACETDDDEAGCTDISWTPHRATRDRGCGCCWCREMDSTHERETRTACMRTRT